MALFGPQHLRGRSSSAAGFSLISVQVGRGEAPDPHPRVHDHGTLTRGEDFHGIEVHLAQLVDGLDEGGDALDQGQQGRAVAGGRPR